MGNTLAAIVLLCIIIVQGFLNIYLINKLDDVQKNNKKFYAKLRREFDFRVKELEQDIWVRDEIIEAGEYCKVRS